MTENCHAAAAAGSFKKSILSQTLFDLGHSWIMNFNEIKNSACFARTPSSPPQIQNCSSAYDIAD